MPWRLADPSHLRWRCWNEQTVIYHVPSADTHVLDAVTATALRHLAAGPLDAPQLAKAVAAEFDAPADEPLVRLMEQTLQRFGALGLLEQALDRHEAPR